LFTIPLKISRQGELGITSPQTTSNRVGLLGSERFTYTNSKAYIFNAFSVIGVFEAKVTLSITGSYLSQSSNAVENLPPLSFYVVLEKCSTGQIYDKSKAM